MFKMAFQVVFSAKNVPRFSFGLLVAPKPKKQGGPWPNSNSWNHISKPSYKRSVDLNLIFAIGKENLKYHVTRAQGRQRKLGNMGE